MTKIDFHTHSTASPDGGISAAQYKKLLDSGRLDMVAVTDHNRIDFAQQLQQELGDKVIVGEEIMTTEGEIVGLHLTELVLPKQSPLETAKAIKAQGGLVYIPHPFETVRKGLQAKSLEAIKSYIDIIEVYNGRAMLQNRTAKTMEWAQTHKVLGAASSDAHGSRGVGYTYTVLDQKPTQQKLLKSLKTAQLVAARPPLRTLTYPKLNRFRKKVWKAA